LRTNTYLIIILINLLFFINMMIASYIFTEISWWYNFFIIFVLHFKSFRFTKEKNISLNKLSLIPIRLCLIFFGVYQEIFRYQVVFFVKMSVKVMRLGAHAKNPLMLKLVRVQGICMKSKWNKKMRYLEKNRLITPFDITWYI